MVMLPIDPPHPGFGQRLGRGRLTRRDALWLLGVSAGASAIASLSGCATSPVSGERILVGMSEESEREVDRQAAPHQFSQDLGAVQDSGLNQYVSQVGASLHSQTHRASMPYSYRVLNANYVNAYTFPAGSVGITRGIMTEMQSEAELAALLGHELGHVNARHAAQRQGQAMVGQAALVGIGIAASDSSWGGLAMIASQVGASALLSSYSRDNEREADALGQEYMTRAGYPATGMVSLHQLLLAEQKQKPGMLDTMFSSHPMPAERVETAKRLAQEKYAASASRPLQKERYMDGTSRLRAIRPTIDACQRGEQHQARKELPQAEEDFRDAIAKTPNDYASNVLMAQCLLAQKKTADAQRYADQAKMIYPQEAQAFRLAGVTRLAAGNYAGAFNELDRFDKLLPGDAGVTFLKGVSLEGAGDRQNAARHYARFLQGNREGKASQYAASRLQSWGFAR